MFIGGDDFRDLNMDVFMPYGYLCHGAFLPLGAWMGESDVGDRATHVYMDVGVRVTQDAVTEELLPREATHGHPWPSRHLHIPVHWDSLFSNLLGSNPIHHCPDKQKPVLERTGLGLLAEREGFEPSVPVRVHMISSQALSTTQAPLQKMEFIK